MKILESPKTYKLVLDLTPVFFVECRLKLTYKRTVHVTSEIQINYNTTVWLHVFLDKTEQLTKQRVI